MPTDFSRYDFGMDSNAREKSTRIKIIGGIPLQGNVSISGCKNAATKILAATILAQEPCRLLNVPNIQDVKDMVSILESMGAYVARENEHTLTVDTRNIVPTIPADVQQLLQRMRSSVLFFGPLLARFGEVSLPYAKGDNIGSRSLDVHLRAFRDLGCSIKEKDGWIHVTRDRTNHLPDTVFTDFSVTATENTLMALAMSSENVHIQLAACEPHTQALGVFLSKMGADVRGCGTHDLYIKGSHDLRGVEFSIIPDYIEAGTFILMALGTGGDVLIQNCNPSHLSFVLEILKRIGAKISQEDETTLHVLPSSLGEIARIQAMPYPGIPTDLQPFFTVLATKIPGVTCIHDPLYENRMGTARELQKMGARVELRQQDLACIEGSTKLHGAQLSGNDIRGAASLIMAGLMAEGETIVEGMQHVDRGYERIEEKLRGLGANVERI